MALGDSPDLLKKMRSLVPTGWFADVAPFQNAVLGGLADNLSWVYNLLSVVKAGTRRATTTGWLMDLDAFSFFGGTYVRRLGETDTAWGKRWRQEVFRPRVTRAAIDKALFDLTGRHPVIIEMFSGVDCGGYGKGGLGYGVAGHYGSLQYPLQVFITAYRPASGGIANAGGYGSSVGGYGSGAIEYANIGYVQSAVSDAEIYATIARTVGAGIIPWTAISN